MQVRNWREVLLGTCELVRNASPSKFGRIVQLKGNKRVWFSRKPEDLRESVRIKGTDIFAEVNHSANTLLLLSYYVLNLLRPDPKIEVELRQ